VDQSAIHILRGEQYETARWVAKIPDAKTRRRFRTASGRPVQSAVWDAAGQEDLLAHAPAGGEATPVSRLVNARCPLRPNGRASRRSSHPTGFTIRSRPSTSMPSCMSSLYSVVQHATRVLATIIASSIEK